MRATLLAAMLLLPAGSSAAAQSVCRSDGPDVAAIRAAIDRYVDAVDREDVSTLVDTYANDIEFMVEGGPTQHGHDHARGNFAAMFAQMKMHYLVTEDEVTVCGPIAYDTGSVVFQVRPKSGGQMRQSKLRFLEIWRKGPNGWQISRLMNNKDG
jgi:ketosteroid isomerase-like protein